MLLNLHVKNFALIEEAEIDFGDGLNILTGETGAGKSLLIDAVNAVLGGRARGEIIRSGCPFAYVEVTFSAKEPEKREMLAALDVHTEYDCVVISRKILPGRSVHKINDETVTSAKVRQVTSLLLDIHGQHEHQSLLHKEKHLAVLDQFGGPAVTAKREEVASLYQRYQKALRALAAFPDDPEERMRQMDFLTFEIQEIEEAAVKPGETEELERIFKKMLGGQRICQALQEVGTLIGGEGAVAERVSRSVRELSEVSRFDEEIEGFIRQLADIEDLLGSFDRELTDYMDSLTFDEASFRETEERLDLLHRLGSKYGDSYEELQESLAERKRKLSQWEDMEHRKAEAEKQVQKSEHALRAAAEELSSLRRAVVPGLTKQLRNGIQELNFQYVDFTISMGKLETPGRDGQDVVEFLISLNQGAEARSLGRVASGGELSRIMLAIKAALADKDEIPTLIFDEIDTGISGRTAQKVSEKLNLIGRHRQVICITHLPQIASMADHHFGIRKAAEGSQTITHVETLDEESAIEELARLLGGAEITEAVYRNACEMRALAAEWKQSHN